MNVQPRPAYINVIGRAAQKFSVASNNRNRDRRYQCFCNPLLWHSELKPFLKLDRDPQSNGEPCLPLVSILPIPRIAPFLDADVYGTILGRVHDLRTSAVA